MNIKWSRWKSRILILILAICMIFTPPVESFAASNPARITSCRLVKGSKIQVKVKISRMRSVPGRKCYVFALPFGTTKIPAGLKPVKSAKKSKHMTFTLKMKGSKVSLNSNFVVAARKKGKYVIVSNTRYVTNPGRMAKYHYKFPKSLSKKGLQISYQMREDAAELNVRNAVINLDLSEVIARSENRNEGASFKYRYQGRTYWFSKAVVMSAEQELSVLSDSNTVVTAILGLRWRDDLTNLIYPSGRTAGHAWYAWNTVDTSARREIEAAIRFLAQRLSSPKNGNARVVNWIVGNEVNNGRNYFYDGSQSLSSHAKIYADAFRLAYNMITSVYSNARVYICLDHLWNYDSGNSWYASRDMLDAFASEISRGGKIPWNLAYHPYNTPLTSPTFWNNTNGWIKSDPMTTEVINMANIGVLTSYVRRKFGSRVRIILSEVGYTSRTTTDASKQQAAAIVYSYYLAEANKDIDSIDFNRHVDNSIEVAQNLNLGLWTSSGGASGETADKQKDSWSAFKYMDTNQAPSETKEYLNVIGKDSWSEAVSGYNSKMYSKTMLARARMKRVKKYRCRTAYQPDWQPYGAVNGGNVDGSWYKLYHDGSRNRNSLWGAFWKPGSPVSMKGGKYLYVTLRITGEQSGKAAVKIRLFSGNKILESIGKVSTGRNVKIAVPVKKWKYRKAVTKIQIFAASAGGEWGSGSTMKITGLGLG